MSVGPKSAASRQKHFSQKSAVTSIHSQKQRRNSRSGEFLRLVEETTNFPARQQTAKLLLPKTQPYSVELPNQSDVKVLPQTESIPTWLRAFIGLQKFSSVTTFLLAGAVLVVYGTTVYTQQLWSREYRKLEKLQRQERQVIAAGEVLKYQLANQAENADAGLVSPHPENNLFLEASPSRPAPEGNNLSQPMANPSLTPTPVGY